MRNAIVMIIICAITFFLFQMVAMAQDEPEAPNTLEEVASFPADFYEQSVTFNAYVSEFLNSGIFVAGENAVFDNDMVLVINNSGEAFPLYVTKGAQVQITGQVHPSLEFMEQERRRNMAAEAVEDTDVDTEVPTPVPLEEQDLEPLDGMGIAELQFIYDGHLNDFYNNFTIIVVDSIEHVEVYVGADGEDISFINAMDMSDDTVDDMDDMDDIDEAEMTEEPDDMDEIEMTEEAEATAEAGD